MSNKLIAIIILVCITVFVILSVSSQQATQQVFDHSQCQYPNRLSNPPNGCDNSDFADPECIHYGVDNCKDDFYRE